MVCGREQMVKDWIALWQFPIKLNRPLPMTPQLHFQILNQEKWKYISTKWLRQDCLYWPKLEVILYAWIVAVWLPKKTYFKKGGGIFFNLLFSVSPCLLAPVASSLSWGTAHPSSTWQGLKREHFWLHSEPGREHPLQEQQTHWQNNQQQLSLYLAPEFGRNT